MSTCWLKQIEVAILPQFTQAIPIIFSPHFRGAQDIYIRPYV